MINFISNKLKIDNSKIQGKGVFAVGFIKKGEVLIDIAAEIVKKPNKYTLQIDENEYLFANFIDNFSNHSCNPNIKVKIYPNNKNRVSYIAIKNINEGEEVCWNYNTTDWELGPFECNCNCKNCIKNISGAKNLNQEERNKILDLTTPFIKEKLIG